MGLFYMYYLRIYPLLDEEQVKKIRAEWLVGNRTLKELEQAYGCSLGKVVRNLSWFDPAYTPPERNIGRAGEKHSRAKLTDEQAGKIRQRRAMGVSLKILARQFGVSPQTISNIANGHRRNKKTKP